MHTCRIVIVSDTHGFLDPQIADIATECDYVVHAGDIGNAQVLDMLHRRRANVIAVRGNNDTAAKWPSKDRARLRRLPLDAQLELPGGTLTVVHGDRAGSLGTRHARLRAIYPDARAIVYGHSHRLARDKERHPWVLNPGAAGRTRTQGGPSCLVLEIHRRLWRVKALRFAQAARP